VKTARHLITKENFDSIISPYHNNMVIRRAGVYHGSLLYFQMNNNPSDGDRLNLTLQADNWVLEKDNHILCNSNTITREFAEGPLTNILMGIRFLGFEVDVRTNMTTINFTGGVSILLKHEISRPVDKYDLIFVFYLPGEQSIALEQGPCPNLMMEIGHQTNSH